MGNQIAANPHTLNNWEILCYEYVTASEAYGTPDQVSSFPKDLLKNNGYAEFEMPGFYQQWVGIHMRRRTAELLTKSEDRRAYEVIIREMANFLIDISQGYSDEFSEERHIIAAKRTSRIYHSLHHFSVTADQGELLARSFGVK